MATAIGGIKRFRTITTIQVIAIIFSYRIGIIDAFSTFLTKSTNNNKNAINNEGNNKNIKYDIPIVICPGFGNDSIDYDRPLNQPPSKGLKTILSTKGFNIDNIYTVPIQRADWIRVGSGLFDIPNFYINQAKPSGLGYGWYLRRVKECVDLAHEESGGKKVMLIGHSAGGWLARAVMGNGIWCEENNIRVNDKISGLVTIGAIHKVPMDELSCVTRGALRYVQENYPGAFLKEEGIKYVSIGGKAIVGDNDDDLDDDSQSKADKVYSVRGEGSASKVAYTSYKAVCGDGKVIGDGVVPLEWSLLEGSRQVELDGALHSINEAGTTIPTDRWYGSESIIDRWLPIVLDEFNLEGNKADGDIFAGMQKWASSIFN